MLQNVFALSPSWQPKKNQSFEEKRKEPGDIIVLHFSTTNNNI